MFGLAGPGSTPLGSVGDMADDQLTEAAGADPERPLSWTLPAAWLRIAAPDADIDPPLNTRPQVLPFQALSWQNFERLCLRILEAEAEVIHAEVRMSADSARTAAPSVRMYGVPGQAQHGIDLYARDPVELGNTASKRRFVTLQARRVQTFGANDLRESVEDFLRGRWAPVSRRFIYATSSSAVSTDLTDEAVKLALELAEKGIELELWDQERLSTRLRDEPRLVDDFFGRPWVERFCAEGAAVALGERLDGAQVRQLREALRKLYQTAFGVADSGLLAIRDQGGQGLSLRDRFVTPDILSTTAQDAVMQRALDDDGEPRDSIDRTSVSVAPDNIPGLLYEGTSRVRATLQTGERVKGETAPQRMPADSWLGQTSRQVVVGDPGAGKSTLLKYLVLDLLNDDPTWAGVAERWGQRLPVWLPFHFFTQRVADQTGSAASVGAAIKAWLEQHNVDQVWPLIEKALRDERLLLVVDGLDEWVNDDAGRYAASAVETFAQTHGVAVAVSSRPYGLSRLTLGAGWDYGRIAVLDRDQQRELALHYFRATTQTGDNGATSEDAVRAAVDAFLAQIWGAPELRAISGIPLFLVLLVGLRLSNLARLPDRRFEVYDSAVDMLIADHPQKRRVAAAVTAQRRGLTEKQTRDLLAHTAFESLTRGDVSTIAAADVRDHLIEALTDPDYLAMERGAASLAADQVLDIAEGELGVLVRKGPRELGFVHRMIAEQLAAEHAANRLSLLDLRHLFEKCVGDPQWREVLLGILWRIRRPRELREIVKAVETRVDETPEGLRAREIVAEAVFGPYDLPGDETQRFAAEIVNTVERHPYDHHRSRLMASILSGLDGVTTRDTVTECLARWTIQDRRPSESLSWHLANLVSEDSLIEPVRDLLLSALRYNDLPIAYSAAVSIAHRCGEGAGAVGDERDSYLAELLNVITYPPSGLAAGAALAALALVWSADEAVRVALEAARESLDPGVRTVALSHSMGVLHCGLRGGALRDVATSAISREERSWLTEWLANDRFSDVHSGLLAAALEAVVRNDDRALDYCIQRIEGRTGMGADLVWTVALRAFAGNDRLAEAVCNEFRTEKYPLFFRLMRPPTPDLAEAYGPGSPHHATVAAAIEDHLERFGGRHRDVEMHNLAAIDQGPKMRETLLQSLAESSNPHWASAALAEHFLDDEQVRVTLGSMLAGDAIRASQIANAIPTVLSGDESIHRLLEILRSIARPTVRGRGRPDITAFALISACQTLDLTSGSEAEAIASEAISLMPEEPPHLLRDAVYDLAIAFYPSNASRSALERLARKPGHPVEPFLAAYRDEPSLVRPHIEEAAGILRSLPANLRSRLCQLLAERPSERTHTLQLTRHWADEEDGANKSIAALTYHQALLEGRRVGDVDDEEWSAAAALLAQQAAAYGPDHEARRRAAWVGMSVLQDWTIVDGLVETIGDPTPIGVPLADPFHGPDITCVRQLAARWEELRDHFGDGLLSRLSGLRGKTAEPDVWDSLAHGAKGHAALERDLEAALAENPDLLLRDGVLAWFISHSHNTEQAEAAIVSRLGSADNNLRGVASVVVMEPERFGLDRTELITQIQDLAERGDFLYGNPALEALAVLDRNHPTIRPAWEHMKEQIEATRNASDNFTRPTPHPQTYLAVAYAAIDNEDIVGQIERDSRWIINTDNDLFDAAFIRNASHRLRHDPDAAAAVRRGILNDTTSDELATVLAVLLARAVTPDQALLDEIDRRIISQDNAGFARLMHDHVTSASLAVKTILTRVADTEWGSV